MTINVTGIVRQPDGTLFTNSTITIQRQGPVVSQASAVLLPDEFTVSTNGSGAVDFDIEPGQYQAYADGQREKRIRWDFNVSETPASQTFDDLVEAATPTITPADVLAAQEAADRAEAAAGDVYGVELYGAVSPGDLSSPMQAAYNAASDGDTVYIPAGAWTCSVTPTLSGTKRVFWKKHPKAIFATDADALRAMPEQPNFTTVRKWERVESKTAYVDGSGGQYMLSGQLRGTGADAAGQRDFMRIEVQAGSSSSGPSWDGIGPSNIARHQVGLSVFTLGTTGQLYQEIWGMNPYAYFPPGSDGQGVGIESNIHVTDQPAEKEIAVGMKLGFLAASKDAAATAAYAIGGLFYKGYSVQQSSLPVDAASRAFELTDLFEVMRDGRTLVGKGASNLFAVGVEIAPDGGVLQTGDNNPATTIRARDDTLAGVANLSVTQARGLSTAVTQRVFTQEVSSCQVATDGIETGRISWATIVNGTLADRMLLQQGLSIGGGAQLVRALRATATLDFASVAAQSVGTGLTVTVTGAVLGDGVNVTPPAAAAAQGVIYDGVVTSANTVTIYPKNITAGAIDPASGTFSVEVRGWV